MPARRPQPSQYAFPKKFVWGVASAALQIEGAATEDGKGESIWDRFAATPGRVAHGQMRRFGIKNYRLSVSWARIHPDGTSAVNQKGLDFYLRLVDCALQNGITPWVTLYHWDMPQALEDAGGWRVRSIPERFSSYAATVVKALGDRVKNWITLNEIPCIIHSGYGIGQLAPGAREPARILNQAYHHTLLAHGYAVQAVREHGGRGAKVGLTHNPDVAVPVFEEPDTIAAAQTQFAKDNAHILAPIYQGSYPTSYLRLCGADRPRCEKGDLALISIPTDFLGLNTYTGQFVRKGSNGLPEKLPFPNHYPQGSLDWLKLVPQSIYWSIRHATTLYGVKNIYITENGAGYEEAPEADGEIIDTHRLEYVRACLMYVHRAIAEGYPCRGYFLWTFLDNFEWHWGYAKRFGIIHTNYQTQKRTPKLSAYWYQKVMQGNQLV
jgi:beta-glucosidase